ncbi:MAG TPA: hypothetical protein VF920_11740 [Dongiaceae bacterium]
MPPTRQPCSILACSILACSILACSILACSILSRLIMRRSMVCGAGLMRGKVLAAQT